MGCGASKPEADEDTVAVLPRPFRHRIEENGQRRPGSGYDGKDGTVSTTGHPHRREESDAATDEEASREGSVAAGGSGGRGEEGKGREEGGGKMMKNRQGGAGEVEREKGGEEEEAEANGSLRGAALLSRGRRGSEGLDDGETPGSPSFRVYFEGSIPGSSDDDWSNPGEIKGEGKRSPGRKDSIDSNTSEGSQGKTPKRYHVRRLRGLTKGSSAVYGLLDVRSRHSQTPLSHATAPARSRHSSSGSSSK